jgi:HrpA-like RNA helicase
MFPIAASSRGSNKIIRGLVSTAYPRNDSAKQLPPSELVQTLRRAVHECNHINENIKKQFDNAFSTHEKSIRRAQSDRVRAFGSIKPTWGPRQVQDLMDLHANIITELNHQLRTSIDSITDYLETIEPTSNSLEVRGRLRRELYRLSPSPQKPLPALALRSEIRRKARTSSFLVVQGSTGSGKSTQLPQYFADMPEYNHGQILCTQPRKVCSNPKFYGV